jgi:hypothetical protein
MSLSFSLRLGKCFLLLVAILALLGVQRCTERVADRMSTVHSAPASYEASAVLPVAYVMPEPWADTARTGGASHLRRKASPRNRWLPAQPAYFRSLPRKPSQHVLDSLSARARQV